MVSRLINRVQTHMQQKFQSAVQQDAYRMLCREYAQYFSSCWRINVSVSRNDRKPVTHHFLGKDSDLQHPKLEPQYHLLVNIRVLSQPVVFPSYHPS